MRISTTLLILIVILSIEVGTVIGVVIERHKQTSYKVTFIHPSIWQPITVSMPYSCIDMTATGDGVTISSKRYAAPSVKEQP